MTQDIIGLVFCVVTSEDCLNMFARKRLLVIAVSCAICSFTSHAAPGARSLAMGGVGVATANYQSASFNNPALLTQSKSNDDVAIILPSLSAEVADPNELKDGIDNFQNAFDAFEAELAGIPQLVDGISNLGQAHGIADSLQESRTNSILRGVRLAWALRLNTK
ncbi:putative plasmid transfer protein [Shewanella benthica KT99]|uniref:Putative plasmid transfer protein n=2 Tax=Shewanella benthica TaxID=43661 RepID=A9DAF7_9GAMM|nr:putative plasmid transfer protein [Shewanella benthica KT99]